MSRSEASLSARDIARRINRMGRLVRESLRIASGRPFAPLPGAPGPKSRPRGQEPGGHGHAEQEAAPGRQIGWWVLAQGRELDPEDFGAREAAREELLEAVRASGVLVGENVWVWDETGRAQLVLATLPTEERARRVAERLRERGLDVVVRREMA